MKQVLTLLIALFSMMSVYAKCGSFGLSAFPNGSTINQNAIFMIEGYADSQSIIKALNKEYPIYLKSGDKIVPLIVTETYVGSFNLTQAILKPENELEAGLEYTLVIDNLPQHDKLERRNTESGEYEAIKYKVLPTVDTDKPVVASKPKIEKKENVMYGCGPSSNVIFSNPAKDDSEFLVKTTMKNVKTKEETTYYLVAYKDTISVGHGMCSGAFSFKRDNDYEIEFAFMDSSGNITEWEGKRIKFSPPTFKGIF